MTPLPSRSVCLSADDARRVRTLVQGAFKGYWVGFEAYITEPATFGHHEWRFGGTLGFGGKLRLDHYRGVYVDCYPEDETPELVAAIFRINDQLADFDV